MGADYSSAPATLKPPLPACDVRVAEDDTSRIELV